MGVSLAMIQSESLGARCKGECRLWSQHLQTCLLSNSLAGLWGISTGLNDACICVTWVIEGFGE